MIGSHNYVHIIRVRTSKSVLTICCWPKPPIKLTERSCKALLTVLDREDRVVPTLCCIVTTTNRWNCVPSPWDCPKIVCVFEAAFVVVVCMASIFTELTDWNLNNIFLIYSVFLRYLDNAMSVRSVNIHKFITYKYHSCPFFIWTNFQSHQRGSKSPNFKKRPLSISARFLQAGCASSASFCKWCQLGW